VGAVRLTERHVRGDPVPPEELARLREAARAALAPLSAMDLPAGGRLVGVAGTVTTLSAVAQALPVYDAERVHGAALTLGEIEALVARLAALTVRARAALPGMEPKRADVILAGAVVVAEAMRATGFERLIVSDRGVRWGLLYDRL
jgi:exopolyphosphatase/guanosine-5'-triphosphate,3'-diphosphate pyrophosphatase